LEKKSQFWVDSEEIEYVSTLLNPLGTGMMGRIEIDRIHVNLPIYQGTDEQELQSGAGYWIGTSLPTGGESTHCVITAHTGLVKAKLFTDLDKLEEGDRFTLHVLDRDMTYEVDQILITEPEDMSALGIVEGKDYVTLYTCYPYGVNTQRLLVRGHRITVTPEEQLEIEQKKRNSQMLILAVLILLVLLFGFFWWRKRQRKKQRKPQLSPLILFMCLCLSALINGTSLHALAADSGGSILVKFQVSNVPFQLYQVAENKERSLQLETGFQGCEIQLDTMEADDLRTAATTLYAATLSGQIEPGWTGTTDDTGQLLFNTLTPGWYLLTSAGYISPTVLRVEEGEITYSEPKLVLDQGTDTPQSGTVDVTVEKKWVDEGYESERPSSIEVQLYQNESLYQTVLLSASNNWTYTWLKLPADATYMVTEKTALSDYRMSVVEESNRFTITNTCTIEAIESEKVVETSKEPEASKPGESEKNIEVRATETNNDPMAGKKTTEQGGSAGAPRTGDTTEIAIWLLLNMSAIGVISVLIKRKKGGQRT
jgi:sortase A